MPVDETPDELLHEIRNLLNTIHAGLVVLIAMQLRDGTSPTKDEITKAFFLVRDTQISLQ